MRMNGGNFDHLIFWTKIYIGPVYNLSQVGTEGSGTMSLSMATSAQTARVPANFTFNRTLSRPRSAEKWRVAASWQKACTRQELEEGGGRVRTEVDSQKILIQEYEGQVYCVSNVCTHLSLPLVGRTALLQGQVRQKSVLGMG